MSSDSSKSDQGKVSERVSECEALEALHRDWRSKALQAPREKSVGALIREVNTSAMALESASMRERWERRDAERIERERQEGLRVRAERWRHFCEKRGGRYVDCRLQNYIADSDQKIQAVKELSQYCSEMPERLAIGENVILFGPKGTGKDHLAMAMSRAATLAYGKVVEWRNGMDLFGDFRDGMDAGEAERLMVNRLVAPDVLYLSDPLPPIGPLTAYQMGMLFRVLDGRYSRMRATWVTLNVASAAELEERLGPQNADRLRHDATAIHCNWPSYRTGGKK